MGALYEALTRNQNLAPVADAIRGYVQKKKDEEKLQNFLRLMEQNKQKVNDLYKAPEETTYSTAPVPQNNFLNKLRTDNIGQKPMQLDVNVPENQIIPSNTPVKPFQLQDIGQVTSQTKPGKLTIEQLRNADKEANNLVIDTLMQGARNQLTPEQQQQAVNMIQLIKQGNQPPEAGKIDERDPEKTYVERDRYGNEKVVQQGTGKQKEVTSYVLDDKGEPKVFTLANGQKAYKKQTVLNGKVIKEDIEQLAWEPKGNVVNIDNTSVAEAMRKMNISNVTGKLTKSNDDYAYWDKISKDPKANPDDKVKAEEQKQIIMGDIKQYSDELTQSVAQQFPSFYPVIEGYLSDPELIADPSKIDKVISEDMKGQEPNLILLTKNVVKSRLFK